MDIIRKDSIVKKHNSLIECTTSMSFKEQKLFIALISLIKKNDNEFKEYSIPAKDLATILNIDKRNIYREIDDTTDKIMSKILKIKTNTGFKKRNFFNKIDYENCILTAKFHEDLREVLLNLTGSFTLYQLENVLKMKSEYSIRVYELLKQYQNIGYREFDIEGFRKYTGATSKSYDKISNLKNKVIYRAIEDINELTDLKIDYEEIRQGRKITKIKFIITSNELMKDMSNKIFIQSKIEKPLEENILSEEESYIQKLKLFIEEELSLEEYRAILHAAKNNIDKIKEKYKVSKVSNYNNLMAFLISAILGDYKMPIRKDTTKRPNKFHNFEQRTSKYTQKELESILQSKNI